MELSTLARPYARAAFAFARQHDKVEPWVQSLALAAAAVREPQIAEALRSPALNRAERADLLQGLYPEPVDAQFGFFIQLLAANDRLSLLPAIDAHFQRFSADLQQSLTVDIHAAEPLSKAEQDTLAKRLNKLLQRDVELRCQQDASLLGGALIRAGDTVIDGSLRGRLARLAEALTA